MADQEGHRLGGTDPQPAPEGAPPGPGLPLDGGTQLHASGQKFAVDFAEANQALAHLEEAFHQLDRASYEGWFLSQAQKPGRDQPSKDFVDVVNPIGAKKHQEILNQRDAVREMRDNLRTQLDSQQRTEQANAANLRRP